MTDIFLSTFKCATTETHLSFTGGKYKITKDSDIRQLYKFLKDDIKNNKDYFLIEKITNPFRFYVDVEKKEEDVDINIKDIAETYKTQIYKYYNVEENEVEYDIIYKTSGDLNKAHIHFKNFYMKKEKDQPKFLKAKVDEILNIKNVKTIDASAYNTGLRMIGAKKVNKSEDKIIDTSPYIPKIEDKNDIDFENYSIRLPRGQKAHDIRDSTVLKQKIKEEEIESDECLISNDDDIVNELCGCLSKKRIDDYSSWINLGILLCTLSRKNNSNYLNLYITLSKQSSKYNPKENFKDLWEGFENYNKYTIATLYYWAKQDNSKKLQEIQKKSMKSNLDNALSCTHDAIAKLLYYCFFSRFIVDIDSNWFIFNSKSGMWKKCLKTHKEVYKSFDELKKIISDYIIDLRKITKDMDKIAVKIDLLTGLKNKLSNETYTKAVISFMQRLFQDDNIVFDNNPLILGFNNGVYDLENKLFRMARPDEYITMTVGYNYVPKRDLTRIKNILKQIHPDESIRNYYLKIMSKSLDFLPKTLVILCTGFQGANGKSFEAGLRHLGLGEYSIRAPCSLITAERETASNSNSALISLMKKRNILFSEPNKNKKINTSTLKELTGGDLMSGRELYGTQKTFEVNGLITSLANRDNELDDCDGGTKRRILKIRYSSRFVIDPKKDNEYPVNSEYEKQEVKLELAKEYVNLLLEYYYEKDFVIPQSVLDDTNEFFNSNNPIYQFINDNIVKDENGIITKKELRQYYDNDFKKDFKYKEFCNCIELELGAQFIRDKKINGKRYNDCMVGYKFKNNEEDECDIDED